MKCFDKFSVTILVCVLSIIVFSGPLYIWRQQTKAYETLVKENIDLAYIYCDGMIKMSDCAKQIRTMIKQEEFRQKLNNMGRE